VARKRSPARLVIALSIAAVLAVFLLYTSIAGGGTPSLKPSELAGQTGPVSLVGQVVGRPTGDSRAGGLRFRLRDVKDPTSPTVSVVYTGSVPDLFASGRDIVVDGTLQNGIFVAATPTTSSRMHRARPTASLRSRRCCTTRSGSTTG
jgi:cytochrome c-type biogenesis protein CcmE